MTPHEFIHKWQPAELSERSSYQQHFLDLCDLLGQEKPAQADPKGEWYTFEKGVEKTQGGKGFADVWMQGHPAELTDEAILSRLLDLNGGRAGGSSRPGAAGRVDESA